MASFTSNLEVAVVRPPKAARTGGDLPIMGGMSAPGAGHHH